MFRISFQKRSISTAVAGLVFVGLLSPANANYQRDAVAVFPDLPISATADRVSTVGDLAPALACSGRPSATAPGRGTPIRGRVDMGAPATAARPGAGPQADHMSRVLTQRAGLIPGGNNV